LALLSLSILLLHSSCGIILTFWKQFTFLLALHISQAALNIWIDSGSLFASQLTEILAICCRTNHDL
jgi:hypothetical protein